MKHPSLAIIVVIGLALSALVACNSATASDTVTPSATAPAPTRNATPAASPTAGEPSQH